MLPMTSASPAAKNHGVLPPAPRQVERRPGTDGVDVRGLLFLMPHTILGLYFAFGAIHEVGLVVLGQGKQGISQLAGPFLVVLFWNGIVGAFWHQLLFLVLEQRWLVKHGHAVPGRVTSQTVSGKRGARGKHTVLKYSYRLPSSTVEMEGCMRLNVVLQQPVSHDGNVTVLFSPARPNHSTIYDCCAYQVATSVA